jgi:NAD(P)-dependent dehydrogenase (short-subunit alcohol dehydrogenase family)
MKKSSLTDRFSLSQKTAVVTGGNGILGKQFCRALAEKGANVVIADLDAQQSHEHSQDLKKQFGVDSIGVECDVSDPASVKRMVAQTVKELGEVNILHNNAVTRTLNLEEFLKPFEEYSLETWKESMSVNIDGMFLVAQAVGKQMISQGRGGSIIQMASIYGMVGPDFRIYEGSSYQNQKITTPAPYATAKAAVIGMTRFLATYWADKGIRVNTLTPGGVESGQNNEFVKKYSSRVPMGRMANPDELSGALIYLASDSSSYVTGQNIIVDGGWTAW